MLLVLSNVSLAAQKNLIVQELESYEKEGRLWRNIVVSPKIKKEELINLAQVLHRENPNVSFRIFSDASKFQEFMSWDRNYPNSTYPYPKEWAKKHYLAIINRMAGEWQLYAMDAGFKKFKLEDSVIARLE
jgi:uncharacterized protein YqiB (DUF1249 family)